MRARRALLAKRSKPWGSLVTFARAVSSFGELAVDLADACIQSFQSGPQHIVSIAARRPNLGT